MAPRPNTLLEMREGHRETTGLPVSRRMETSLNLAQPLPPFPSHRNGGTESDQEEEDQSDGRLKVKMLESHLPRTPHPRQGSPGNSKERNKADQRASSRNPIMVDGKSRMGQDGPILLHLGKTNQMDPRHPNPQILLRQAQILKEDMRRTTEGKAGQKGPIRATLSVPKMQ